MCRLRHDDDRTIKKTGSESSRLFAAKFGPQAALLHFDVYYSKRVNFIRGGVTSCYLTGSFLRFYERMLLQKEDGAGR